MRGEDNSYFDGIKKHFTCISVAWGRRFWPLKYPNQTLKLFKEENPYSVLKL